MTDFNVLVVDDDAGDRKLIRRMLRHADFPVIVTEADAGHVALDIENPNITAILLDHLLPGETGLDVLRHLRKKWPQAGIVLMTGQGNEDIAKSAIKLGANDYLAKSDITEASLIRMLKTAVDVATMQWKLEEHRRDLETFSDVLIHDLRSPIRGAIFLSEEIIEAIEGGDLEAAKVSARLMRKAAGQLAEFVDSLSKLARIDHDEALDVYSAAEIVDRALTALSREIEESGAQIDIRLDLPRITCRPAQLAQLLQNLVANAIKYCGDRPPKIAVTGQPRGRTAQMCVSDAGIGVPEAYRTTIFRTVQAVALGLESGRHRVWA